MYKNKIFISHWALELLIKTIFEDSNLKEYVVSTIKQNVILDELPKVILLKINDKDTADYNEFKAKDIECRILNLIEKGLNVKEIKNTLSSLYDIKKINEAMVELEKMK